MLFGSIKSEVAEKLTVVRRRGGGKSASVLFDSGGLVKKSVCLVLDFDLLRVNAVRISNVEGMSCHHLIIRAFGSADFWF